VIVVFKKSCGDNRFVKMVCFAENTRHVKSSPRFGTQQASVELPTSSSISFFILYTRTTLPFIETKLNEYFAHEVVERALRSTERVIP